MNEGLKMAGRAQTFGADVGCAPCREPTVKEILTRRADDLRREALSLENLAAQYPEGFLQQDTEATLRRLLMSSSLYR